MPREHPPASPISTSFARSPDQPYLTFGPLARFPFLRHAFTLRHPEAPDPAAQDDSTVLRYHDAVLDAIGASRDCLVTGRQIHGNRIAIAQGRPSSPLADTDGLLTNTAGLALGVYVADCCAVFLIDRGTRAIGLLHSGKKGTQANIAGNAIDLMRRAFGTDPAAVLAVLSPCIGPCHYEMDIPAGIEQQLRAAGLRDIISPRVCTACDLERFYSYRVEKGQTGRMLAVILLLENEWSEAKPHNGGGASVARFRPV